MSQQTKGTFIYSPAQNPDGWQLLSRVSLSGAATSISSGTIPARTWLWVQLFCPGKSGTITISLRCNGDSGNNYCNRFSQDGGADGVTVSTNQFNVSGGVTTSPVMANLFIINIAGQVKRFTGLANEGSVTAATAPNKREQTALWVNTTDQITEVTLKSFDGIVTLNAGTTMMVYGAN